MKASRKLKEVMKHPLVVAKVPMVQSIQLLRS